MEEPSTNDGRVSSIKEINWILSLSSKWNEETNNNKKTKTHNNKKETLSKQFTILMD